LWGEFGEQETAALHFGTGGDENGWLSVHAAPYDPFRPVIGLR